MKKLILIILLNLFLPLALLVVLPSVAITKRQGTSIGYDTKILPFVKTKPIIFTFISDYPQLQSLSLDLKNPGLKNTSKITFNISNSTSSQTIVFSGANVGDPSTVPLKFPQFNDPKSTKYTVTITTDNPNDSSLYLVVNNSLQPIFNSYYLQPNIKTNLSFNFYRQIDLIKQRSQIHNFIYFFLIILLDYLILTCPPISSCLA